MPLAGKLDFFPLIFFIPFPIWIFPLSQQPCLIWHSSCGIVFLVYFDINLISWHFSNSQKVAPNQPSSCIFVGISRKWSNLSVLNIFPETQKAEKVIHIHKAYHFTLVSYVSTFWKTPISPMILWVSHGWETQMVKFYNSKYHF